MKEMMAYLRPYRRSLLWATVAIAVSTICDLLLPTIMSDILNRGVYQADFAYIVRCCVRMLVVALAGLGSVLWGSKLSADVVAGYCADLREKIFRKVNAMDVDTFSGLGTASLVTRATTDVEMVSWIASMMCGTVITIPVLFFGGVILSMRKDGMLSLLLLVFLPVIFWIVYRISKRIGPLWDKCDQYGDLKNELVRQRLRGIRVVRAFQGEKREHERIADAVGEMSAAIIQSNVEMGKISPVVSLMLNFAAVLVVYFGGFRMERGGSITGGDLFAIVQYIALISNSVILSAYMIANFPQAQVSARRIGEVLGMPDAADPVSRQDVRFSGDIVFENVGFTYEGAREPAVEAVSMHIRPGEKAAIIGGTGAGKTTLVNMLMGFRNPTQGRILLDGKPTAELSRRSLRDNIRCALQNVAIYSGSVAENVAMGEEGAEKKQVLSALEDAQAEFVASYPEGADHILEQAGKNLSGGQRQRVSIARAIVKDVPIYIFDDSFSALDYLTEAKLRSALSRRLAGRTQLLITQRVSSAMHCDRIFVMNGGRLAGQGTHRELLQTCPVYREIYESQTGGNT